MALAYPGLWIQSSSGSFNAPIQANILDSSGCNSGVSSLLSQHKDVTVINTANSNVKQHSWGLPDGGTGYVESKAVPFPPLPNNGVYAVPSNNVNSLNFNTIASASGNNIIASAGSNLSNLLSSTINGINNWFNAPAYAKNDDKVTGQDKKNDTGATTVTPPATNTNTNTNTNVTGSNGNNGNNGNGNNGNTTTTVTEPVTNVTENNSNNGNSNNSNSNNGNSNNSNNDNGSGNQITATGAGALPRVGDKDQNGVAYKEGDDTTGKVYTYNVSGISLSGTNSVVLGKTGNETIVIYSDGDISMSGKSSIVPFDDGNGNVTQVKFFVNGDVDITGNALSSNNPTDYQVYVYGARTVKVAGNGNFFGFLFAPDSTLELKGSGNTDEIFTGAAWVKTYSTSGNHAVFKQQLSNTDLSNLDVSFSETSYQFALGNPNNWRRSKATK